MLFLTVYISSLEQTLATFDFNQIIIILLFYISFHGFTYTETFH